MHEGPDLRHVAEDLRQVKRELVEHRIDCRAFRLAGLERELAGLRTDLDQLGRQEAVNRQNLQVIETQLNMAGISTEERAALEAMRSQASGFAEGALQAERAGLMQRQAKLQTRLDAERAVMQKLVDRLGALSSADPAP
jgi:hypothetical protein